MAQINEQGITLAGGRTVGIISVNGGEIGEGLYGLLRRHKMWWLVVFSTRWSRHRVTVCSAHL